MKNIIILVLVVAFVTGLIMILPEQIEEPKENQLKKFSSYYELQNFLKTNLESYTYGGILTARTAIAETLGAAEAPETKGAEDYSATNIQVAGVDEADIVKNDGKYIYIVSGNKIVIVNAYPPQELSILSTIELDGTPTEIFVNNNKLVIFGNQFDYYAIKQRFDPRMAMPSFYPYYPPKVFVYVYDISNRENPTITRNITLDGNYVDSRMIGDYAYVVINSPINDVENITLPAITSNGNSQTIPASEIFYFDFPDYSYMFTTLISINTQNNQEDISSKVILMGSTQNIFVSLNNIYITYQKVYSYYDYQDRIVEKVLLPNLPTDVVNEIQNIRNSNIDEFEKFERIGKVVYNYLETLSKEERSNLEETITNKIVEVEIEIQKEIQKTVIHRISIVDGTIEYKANGEVPGYVLNQFSMDEYNGYFRIATTTSEFFGGGVIVPLQGGGGGGRVIQEVSIASEAEILPPEPAVPPRQTSYNHVYILDENLNTVGKLENLAPGENIFSARFLGDRVYLVTFRRIDPLFVIDLSEPTNPKVLGELKIPGFSDYLHPYDENHVIGIGREVSEGGFPLIQGVKLGLFDVTDPTNPREIAKYEIGTSGTDSEALRDHKAFLFSRSKNLLVIPILLTERILPESFGYYVWQGAYVFDVSLENGFVEKGRVTHIPTDESVEYYFFSPYSVKRSLYIDDILYTVSDRMVKANNLAGLEEINKVELPFEVAKNEGIIPLPLAR